MPETDLKLVPDEDEMRFSGQENKGEVKTLQHQVVYLKPSRNLCHSCHCILCKENEKAKFSSR